MSSPTAVDHMLSVSLPLFLSLLCLSLSVSLSHFSPSPRQPSIIKRRHLFTNLSASSSALDNNNSLSAARMCSSARALRPTALSANCRPLLLAIFSRLAFSCCEVYFRFRITNTSIRFFSSVSVSSRSFSDSRCLPSCRSIPECPGKH